MRSSRFLIILIWITFLPGLLSGQYYFGKNKVHYEVFDWNLLETDHFRIYFYDEEQWLARITAHYAEQSFAFLEDKFNHHIFNKIPLIIYSSPNYFTQTNVIPAILPENVAGFTEFYKNRMVIPFDGSLSEFLRVVQHEMVHVFTYSKLSRVLHDHRKFTLYGPPLWFTEGLAEYWSRTWDSEADMMIADLMVSGNFINYSNIYQISGTFLMYKVGESLCHYIAEEYGQEKLLLLFENWWKASSFESVIVYTLGKPLKDIFDDWQYSLKKKYFPALAEADYPGRYAKRLTEPGFFVKPIVVETDGDSGKVPELICKANQLGYSGLYTRPLNSTSTKVHVLLKGERSSEFESLYILRSSISASHLGELVFAARRFDRDVLYFMEIESGHIIRTARFDSLISIISPTYSADGSLVAFAGAGKDGRLDLYLYDIGREQLTRLTDDFYNDRDPAWAPDNSKIIFSSDRGANGVDGFMNLFELDLDTREITQITCGKFNDLSPSYSADGTWRLFSSDRNGRANIYALDEDDQLYEIGKTLTGCFDPRFVPGDSLIVFSAFQEYGFQIYSVPFKDSSRTLVDREEIIPGSWDPAKIDGQYAEGIVKYQNDYSLDVAQSAIAYDAVYGSAGGIQVGLSDILGNHQYYFLLYNTAQSKASFLSSFNAAVTYLNRERRLNYGVGLYHFYDEYDDRHDGLFEERVYGGLASLSYPFSKFHRIEASLFLRKSEKTVYFADRYRGAWLTTGYLSYIKDNSIWDFTGPLDGSRYNLTAGMTYDLASGTVFNRLYSIDLRKYFRLAKYSAYALRFFAFGSSGKEPQRLYLGGSWSLRGYDRRTWYERNLLLFSNELRFPLINRLQIGLPIGSITISGIRGATFFDVGSAWDKKFNRFYGAFGFGARVALGYFLVLRFDLAHTTDFIKLSHKWKFNFFFGWNF